MVKTDKKRIGRPPGPTILIDLGEVERLAPLLSQAQMADYLGIGERTLARRFAEDPAFEAAYKKGRARAIEGAVTSLLGLVAERNIGAICFFLKCQARWRETDRPEDIQADAPSLIRRLREAEAALEAATRGG